MKKTLDNLILKIKTIYSEKSHLIGTYKLNLNIKVLLYILFFTFLFSLFMIFINRNNLLKRVVFLFYSKNYSLSNERYLHLNKRLKNNLDLIVREFLLGTNEGLSLDQPSPRTRLLNSFLKNKIYYLNLSKEFYDIENFDINMFKLSLFKTLNFNYPGSVNELLIYIEEELLDY